jgi:tetratricopeptide (TPR) repeat protein
MRLMLILALLCAPLLHAQDDPVRLPAPKKGQEHVMDGEDAFADGRMHDAVDHFTKAIAVQPDNDELYAYRAAAYVALDKITEAETDIDEAMKLETTFSLAYNTRGYVRWLKRELAAAVEDYTAALAYAADDRRVDAGGRAQMYQNRGIAYQDAGNTDRALLDFNRCIELAPAYAAFYENRALIYVDKELFDIAFKDFDTALELDPKSARAYVNRAWAARLMGDFEQSVRDYSQALRLKTDYAQAVVGRGYAWLGWGRIDSAVRDFETASKLPGFEAGGIAGLGDVKLMQEKVDEALALYVKAHEADQHSIAALRGMASALVKKGDHKQAEAFAVALCAEDGKSARNWQWLGDLRTTLLDTEGALVAYNRALEINPEDHASRKGRFTVHLGRNEYLLALSDADALVRLDAAAGHVQKARVHALRGNGLADTNNALGELELARAAGADLTVLKDHPDFGLLHGNPTFKELVRPKK